MELKTQICSCCHEEKPVTEFYRHPTSKTGYDSRCKACVTKRAKELRQRRKLLTPPRFIQAESRVCRHSRPRTYRTCASPHNRAESPWILL